MWCVGVWDVSEVCEGRRERRGEGDGRRGASFVEAEVKREGNDKGKT